MAQRTTWPDGEPRRDASTRNSVNEPGVPPGQRHTADTEPPKQNFGFVTGTAAQTNPMGTPYSKIDIRAGGPAKYTVGDQRSRKPR